MNFGSDRQSSHIHLIIQKSKSRNLDFCITRLSLRRYQFYKFFFFFWLKDSADDPDNWNSPCLNMPWHAKFSNNSVAN